MPRWLTRATPDEVRRYNRERMAARRQQWRRQGDCVGCGRARDSKYLHCATCRAGLMIRDDRHKQRSEQ